MLTIAQLLVFVVCLSVVTTSAGAEMPEALEAALAAREFNRGCIQYARETRTAEGVARELADGVVVGDSLVRISSFQGVDGVVNCARDLFTPEGTWTNLGHSIAATVQLDQFDVGPKLNHLGVIFPHPRATDINYRVEVSGDQVLVIAQSPGRSGESRSNEIRYWLDPLQDFAITQVEVWTENRCVRRNMIENARYNDRWFPVRVAEFVNEDKHPQTVWRIAAAEFETTNCPSVVTPADIGVQVGTWVSANSPRRERAGSFVWDGRGLSTAASVRERVASGELAYGLDFSDEFERANNGEDIDNTVQQRAAARLKQYWWTWPTPTSAASDKPTPRLWEAEVSAFISRYNLSTEQAQRAWIIHSDCVATLEHWIRRHRTSLEKEGQKSSDKFSTAMQSPTKLALERLLSETLEEKLRPRLETLLTRNQRKLDR